VGCNCKEFEHSLKDCQLHNRGVLYAVLMGVLFGS
jgi:hypothetical protein